MKKLQPRSDIDGEAALVERLIQDFDHHDPDFTPDIALRVHRGIRERTPVTFSRAHGGMWVLSRYDDVQGALRDHVGFRSGAGVFFPRAAGAPYFAPLEYDPPEHTQFRELMRPAFTSQVVKKLMNGIREVVAKSLRPLVDGRHVDLAAELMQTLPLTVLSLAIGFSPEATDRILGLTENTWSHMAKDMSSEGFWPAYAEMLDREIDRARTQSREDSYLSGLVRQKKDGRDLTDDDLRAMLVAFAIAGHETTKNTGAHLLWHLAGHPEDQAVLASRPDLRSAAVDEAMRFYTPVDHGTRQATRDIEVGGVVIPEGGRVVLLGGAANRDPAKFDDPESFRLDRTGASHVTFGFGIHYCIGSHLARAELITVLDELAKCPPFVLDGPVLRRYANGRHINMDSLPVVFEGTVPSADRFPQAKRISKASRSHR